MKNGIYRIRNLTNGKCYIGSAASKGGFKNRWKDHRKFLGRNKHHSRKLQNAWNKYGADAFAFEILLYCDPENCLIYEQIALDHYKPEYNIYKIAGSSLGTKHSDKTKAKLRQIKTGLHLGEKNPAAKINEQIVRSILDDMESGMRGPAISKKYNLSLTQTKAIMAGRSWSHILASNEIEKIRQRNLKSAALGSRNGRSKLTEQNVLEIKLTLRYTPIKDIATKFGVSISCIKNIKYEYKWSHI